MLRIFVIFMLSDNIYGSMVGEQPTDGKSSEQRYRIDCDNCVSVARFIPGYDVARFKTYHRKNNCPDAEFEVSVDG